MLKIKSQIKSLSLVVTLGLFSSSVSAVSVYSTNGHGKTGSATVGNPGDYAAARFTVDAADCPNGCDLTQATLRLLDIGSNFNDTPSLAGLKLSVYSNVGAGNEIGTELFDFDVSGTLNNYDITSGGTNNSFSVTDSANSLVLGGNTYWLKLEDIAHTGFIQWGINTNILGGDEFYIGYQNFGLGFEFLTERASPLLFELEGIPRAVAPIPVPGAVWMMGSALFGLLVSSRRKPNKFTATM